MPADHRDPLAVASAFSHTSDRFRSMRTAPATEQADKLARSAALLRLSQSGERDPEKLRAAMRAMKAEQGR